LFIVNDRLDIALASNADGIHLGQDDLDLQTARNLLGYSKIIGISANNEIDISNALKEGCDYIGIGPVFETTTKKGKKPLGIEKIKTLTKDLNIPWFAIGGIKSNNISYLKRNNIRASYQIISTIFPIFSIWLIVHQIINQPFSLLI